MREFNLFAKILSLAMKNGDYSSLLGDFGYNIHAFPLKLSTIIEICKKHNYKAEIGDSLDSDNLTCLEAYIKNTESLDILTSSILDLQKKLNGNQIIFTNPEQTKTVIFYQINTGDN